MKGVGDATGISYQFKTLNQSAGIELSRAIYLATHAWFILSLYVRYTHLTKHTFIYIILVRYFLLIYRNIKYGVTYSKTLFKKKKRCRKY